MTSATTPKTIELRGEGIQHEATALGAITAGMLVERAAGGVQAHSTAGGAGTTAFANEYCLTGQGIDDAYETGDNVIFTDYPAGASVYALVPAAAAAIAEGALLQSNGDGTLILAAAGDNVVARALEAVDNSGGASAARIRVEITTGYIAV